MKAIGVLFLDIFIVCFKLFCWFMYLSLVYLWLQRWCKLSDSPTGSPTQKCFHNKRRILRFAIRLPHWQKNRLPLIQGVQRGFPVTLCNTLWPYASLNRYSPGLIICYPRPLWAITPFLSFFYRTYYFPLKYYIRFYDSLFDLKCMMVD